jgi:hypothetical protein
MTSSMIEHCRMPNMPPRFLCTKAHHSFTSAGGASIYDNLLTDNSRPQTSTPGMFFCKQSLLSLGSTSDPQVFESLNRARTEGLATNIPDSEQIIPFVGLYSLVILRPSQVTNLCHVTPHLPGLSLRNGRHFTKAPGNTLPNAPSVARIFGVFAMGQDVEEIYGRIPLSPSLPDFAERRF